MHKRMTAAVLGLCMVVAIAGCGRASITQKKTLDDFQKITKIPSVYFSSFKKFNSLTDVSALLLTADAGPDETTERHTAETSAKIYSSNSTGSGVIGEFEEDDEVMVLEKMTGTNWYKIVYNGRVAYVQANVLEVKSDSEGSYNNYIGYSDDVEDFDEAAAHSGDTYDGDDEPGTVPEPTDPNPTDPTDNEPTDPTDQEPTDPTDPEPTDPTDPTEPISETDPTEPEPDPGEGSGDGGSEG